MTATLKGWDFSDETLNGSQGLINRQKSAGNLVLLSLDQQRRTAVFLDREKKLQSNTSLDCCDCRDFHFVGKLPRKTYQPCKHVYRLAMELGLLSASYLDHEAREALRLRGLGELKHCEDDRLQSLGRDDTAWGGWPDAVHASGLQQNRQYRAYFIVQDEPDSIVREGLMWRIRDYTTSLSSCECADFRDRRLPCKHIYAVALQGGIPLVLSRGSYEQARQQGRKMVFEFENERLDPLGRF